MTDQDVRVRIAPSPTGYLHVGTARTAIFNYLFARHYGGKFLVRIEDTDLGRSRRELIEPILASLRWLGIKWDEEIIFQSKRLEHYRKMAQQLLDAGHAYRCFCSPEKLTEDREKARAEKKPLKYNRRCLSLSEGEIGDRLAKGGKPALRLRIPDGETTYCDMVAGDITRRNDELEDFIIARGDGSATYNLAVVVDDHEMGISHVIRGNDHITNTFKQIHLYRALGWEIPTFGHVPLILRPDKRKVSKRLGDKDVGEYRHEGILPDAMFNYLSLLGWSPKTEREIYTPDELISLFNEMNFNASNAVFDQDKLDAFNREHIQLMSDHDLAVLVAPLLVEAGVTTKYWLETRWEYLRNVIRVLKGRVRRVTDFVSMGSYFFEADFTYDSEAEAKHFTPEARERLRLVAERSEALEKFTHETIEAVIAETAEELGIKRAALIHPVRLAVSGRPAGPGLYDLLVCLGREAVVERLRKAVDYMEHKRTS